MRREDWRQTECLSLLQDGTANVTAALTEDSTGNAVQREHKRTRAIIGRGLSELAGDFGAVPGMECRPLGTLSA